MPHHDVRGGHPLLSCIESFRCTTNILSFSRDPSTYVAQGRFRVVLSLEGEEQRRQVKCRTGYNNRGHTSFLRAQIRKESAHFQSADTRKNVTHETARVVVIAACISAWLSVSGGEIITRWGAKSSKGRSEEKDPKNDDLQRALRAWKGEFSGRICRLQVRLALERNP